MKYPYEKAVATVAKGTVDGANALLGAICLPAAEEFGLLLKDKVSGWRQNNALNITGKTQIFLKDRDITGMTAHPRIVMDVIEKGSWESEDYIQTYWAGLLASSVTSDGEDDSNLLFIDLLGRMTTLQVKILTYACENCSKFHSSSGWIFPDGLVVNIEQLQELTSCADLHRLDRELDFLRELGLIGGGFGGGFEIDATDADISPSSLALQMYVRCQGYVGAPTDYFNTTEADPIAVSQAWEREKDAARQSKENKA